VKGTFADQVFRAVRLEVHAPASDQGGKIRLAFDPLYFRFRDSRHEVSFPAKGVKSDFFLFDMPGL
jgi:hypothetical protein